MAVASVERASEMEDDASSFFPLIRRPAAIVFGVDANRTVRVDVCVLILFIDRVRYKKNIII